MAIAPQAKAFAEQVALLETKLDVREQMLTRLMDLHNDLLDWTTNTEHAEAALEVGAILETYIKKAADKTVTVVAISEEMTSALTG